jgi:hypothetical protein
MDHFHIRGYIAVLLKELTGKTSELAGRVPETMQSGVSPGPDGLGAGASLHEIMP